MNDKTQELKEKLEIFATEIEDAKLLGLFTNIYELFLEVLGTIEDEGQRPPTGGDN